jgi:soluble lytic murein transglycosylase
MALHTIALPAVAPAAPLAAADLGAIKRAIDLVQKGKTSEASDIAKTVGDAAAVKLIEWTILRGPGGASFERYAAFARANPTWPSVGLIRKRAEGTLWDDKRDTSLVRAYFADAAPQSGKGRLALTRALLAQGQREAALEHLQDAWRQDSFTAETEQEAMGLFRDLLTRADHKARMDRFLYSDERAVALRAAARLGGHDALIAKARIAVDAKAGNAGALLDAVPAEARRDAGYIFSRSQWLRRKDKIAEAAQLMQTVPQDAAAQHDLDEWWVERRLLARELLDMRDYQSAYRIVRDALPPFKENYRVDHEFTAGWIALRFLDQPAKALEHLRASAATHRIQPVWRAANIGRAARWKRWIAAGRRARITKRRREILRPITASLRAPVSAIPMSCCTGRPSFPASSRQPCAMSTSCAPWKFFTPSTSGISFWSWPRVSRRRRRISA